MFYDAYKYKWINFVITNDYTYRWGRSPSYGTFEDGSFGVWACPWWWLEWKYGR